MTCDTWSERINLESNTTPEFHLPQPTLQKLLTILFLLQTVLNFLSQILQVGLHFLGTLFQGRH